MVLTISLPAIKHNASVVSDLASAAGVSLVAALKAPFALPEIVAAIRDGGISKFALSGLPPSLRGSSISFADRQLIGLHLPRDADQIATCYASSLHTDIPTIEAMAAVCSPLRRHGIWLGIRTSDDREGFHAEELVTLMPRIKSACSERLEIEGLFANWGCQVRRLPPVAEIRKINELADQMGEIRVRNSLAISVGGSVMMPMLGELPGTQRATQWRVGEAILTGTIPGYRGSDFGLKRVFTIVPEILEVKSSATVTRVLLSAGDSHFCAEDAELVSHAGRLIRSSSELTVVELMNGAQQLGDSVVIALGFRSALRALCNASLPRAFKWAYSVAEAASTNSVYVADVNSLP